MPWCLRLSRVFVLYGVNLGILGTRRPEVYGHSTLSYIEGRLRERFPEVDFEFRQTDHESEMAGFVREVRDSAGIVINPGVWAHYSYALHDALEAVEDVSKVNIHHSNVHAREAWRRHSLISSVVNAVVAGTGPYGYEAAMGYILGLLKV